MREFAQPLLTPFLEAGASDRQVDVTGNRGLLTTWDSGTNLRLQLGDTAVAISADTEDRALDAGGALAKLN
jgi:hypothetical protein